MPEDNFLECINVIAETMKGTRWVGEWYGECFRWQTFFAFYSVDFVETTSVGESSRDLNELLNRYGENGTSCKRRF